jgi:hypothetical protein
MLLRNRGPMVVRADILVLVIDVTPHDYRRK